MKTLYIDCQLFQTPTLHRGMGRYTLGILYALQKYQAEFVENHRLVGVFNSNYEEDRKWQELLVKTFPNIEFVGLGLHTIESNNIKSALENNRQIIGDYIDADDAEQDSMYFIPALLDDTIYACFPKANKSVSNVLLFHDLIPYLFWDRYLGSDQKKAEYFYRLKDVFAADIILCNSETTANDLARFLFIPHDRLKILRSGDPNDVTLLSKDEPMIDRSLHEGLAHKKIILSISGDDIRKNNIRMAAAFDQFNRLNNNEYHLVITSNFGEETKRQLYAQTKNLIFTGNVSTADLQRLYKKAECILFVPEYEGLGLPILEAVKFDANMVVSDIEVFRELTDEGVYFASPEDPARIATALHETVNGIWKPKPGSKKTMLEKWNWEEVAKDFVGSTENVSHFKTDLHTKNIAIVAPHPIGISAIGRFVQSHHAVMSRSAAVTYYLEKSPSVIEDKIAFLPYVADCKLVTELPNDLKTIEYDEIIYHVGNSDYHLATTQYALRYPGTLVVHDTDLRGLAGVSLAYGLWDRPRYKAEERLNDLLKIKKSKLNFSGSLVNASKKVITHSHYAEEAVRKALDPKQITVANKQLPMIGPINYKRLAKNEFLHVGIAGIINSSKGTDILRMALANPESSKSVLYHLFGYSFASDQIELLRMYELGPIVLELNLPDLLFQNRLRAMDVLLNYRPQYHGEASSATLEAMRYGVVPIVRDIGWFSKLPDEVAYKVSSVDDVPAAINDLSTDRTKLKTMSKAAYEYVRSGCSVYEYVEECVRG